jgi:peptidyl-prolyl cis-trans isomerase D
MLRDIKQKSSGLFAKIIMGLLIIAFGFWGVSGSLLMANNDSAATVNGKKITINDFNIAVQNSKSRLRGQFGDNLGSEYFESENFKRGVLNQIIDAELLRQEAEKFSYDVSPSRVKEYIQSIPGFQIDGKFSPEAYANYLAQVNKSAELLERDIKDDIKGSALRNMVGKSAISLDSEINTQYKFSKQKRDFDYLELSSKDYEKDIEVTEEEINSHYKEFSADYMTPELISVNYVELSVSDLLPGIELTEEEIKDSYEERKDTLMTAEKRKAQHILLPVANNAEEVKVEIEEVAKRIANGENFSEVAKEVSKDPGSAPSGGDLGWVSPGDMVEAFDAKLFSMNSGEVSEPVLSKFGYHIIKVNEIKSPKIPALEEIKDQIVKDLKLDKASEEFLSKADELDTAIVDSDNSLDIAAEAVHLELKSTELFAQGRGVGIAANPKFSTAAFSDTVKTDNEISEMIDLGENHVAYIHIKEHKLPQVKELSEVSDIIKNKILAEKSFELVKTKVAEFEKSINAGEKSLTDIAKSINKEVVEAKNVERTGSKQPFKLVQEVFSLKLVENNSVHSVEASANSIALVNLKTINNADTTSLTDDEKAGLSSQIERSATNAELSNIVKSLQEDASIVINEKIFEVIN